MSLDPDTMLLQAAVARGLVTSNEARACLEAARRAGCRASRLLVERGRLDRATVQALEATLPPDAATLPPPDAATLPPPEPTLRPPTMNRPLAAPAGDATWWNQAGATHAAPTSAWSNGASPAASGDDDATLPLPTVAPQPRAFGAATSRVLTGTVLGDDWEVLEALGSGGMGMVYRARQRSLGREVALKVLPPDVGGRGSAAERFLREARSSAAVNHPNVITVFAAGRDEATGQLFIAMELVRGGDAAALAKKSGGRLPERRALEIARDVARGLTALEAGGLVHRDIKPANMFLAADGTAKLADLGLARGLADRMTETGAVVGTPAYMSPEQAQGTQGELDIGTDIYAVGASLYTLLTGNAPFEGGSVLALLRQVLDAPPPDPRRVVPSVSAATVALIARAMAKQRSSRHATAADLVADLERALAGLDTAGAPSRSAALVVMSAALIAVGVAGVAFGLTVVPVGEPEPVASATEPAAATTEPVTPPEPAPVEPAPSATESVAPVPSTVITWTARDATDTGDIAIASAKAMSVNDKGFVVLWRMGVSSVTVRFHIQGSPSWVHLRIGHLGANAGEGPDAWIDIDLNGRPLLVEEKPSRPQFFDITEFATPGENELEISLKARSKTQYWLDWIQVHHGKGPPPPFLGTGRVDR